MNRTNGTMEPVFEEPSGRAGHDAHVQVRMIAFVGLMGAVSTVLMLLRFPLPFLPPFMSFDLSGVMEIMGGYLFGPVGAFFVIIVKILLQLIIQGSLSFGTGEIQGLILAVNPAKKDTATMVLLGILPFNLIKYGATSAVTFFVYKRLSKVIRRIVNG